MIYPKKLSPYPPMSPRDSARRAPINNQNSRKTLESQAKSKNQPSHEMLINEEFKISKENPFIHKQTSLYDLKIDFFPDSYPEKSFLSPKGICKTERMIESISMKNPVSVVRRQYQRNERSRSKERSRENSRDLPRKKIPSESAYSYEKKQGSGSRSPRLQVEPFIPVKIPPSTRKKVEKTVLQMERDYSANLGQPQVKREIEIFLEKDKSPVRKPQEIPEQKRPEIQKAENRDDSSLDLMMLGEYSDIQSPVISLQDRDSLRRLFRKVRKLTDQLQTVRQEKNRLVFQIGHLKSVHGQCGRYQEGMNRLQNQNYKLKTQIQVLKKEFDMEKRERSMERLYTKKRKCPGAKGEDGQSSRSSLEQKKSKIKEVIIEKQVIVEKPVYIQVPKYIEGPERIVEKVREIPTIVQVPKYIEVEKKIPGQPIRQVVVQTKILEIEKPVYLDKLIYVDKPVYIDRPVECHRRHHEEGRGEKEREVEFLSRSPPSAVWKEKQENKGKMPASVPVPYPYQVPVYIEKPGNGIVEQTEIRIVESQNLSLRERNCELTKENIGLRTELIKSGNNFEVLKRHNQSKNRQVEQLLRNHKDYSLLSSETATTVTQRQSFRRF